MPTDSFIHEILILKLLISIVIFSKKASTLLKALNCQLISFIFQMLHVHKCQLDLNPTMIIVCVLGGLESETIAVPCGKISELFIGLSKMKQAVISLNRVIFFNVLNTWQLLREL